MNYIYNAEKQKKSKKRRQNKKPTSLREQLLQKVVKPKLIKESPQEMVERLWERRMGLYSKMNLLDRYSAKASTTAVPALTKAVARLDERINGICESRGVKHPGM